MAVLFRQLSFGNSVSAAEATQLVLESATTMMGAIIAIASPAVRRSRLIEAFAPHAATGYIRSMERVELVDGHVEIRQTTNTEGVGYELTFNVAAGSATDSQLDGCFHSGKLLPLPHAGEDLSVSLRTQAERDGRRIYEGTAGFLRPGMGGAGG